MKKVFKSKAYKDKLKGHKDGVIKICAPHGPESGFLLSASKDGSIRAWDLIERKITTKLLLSRDGNDSSQMIYYRDDQQSGDEDDGNRNYLQKQRSQEVKKELDSLIAVCFTENQIFGGYEDGMMCSWNLKDGSQSQVYKGHTGAISEMEFLNTRLLVSSSLDQTIRVWDASSSKVTKSVCFSSTAITCFITHENQLIIATIDNVMEIYNLDTLEQENLQPVFIIENNKDWILCMKIQDQFLYTGGDDRRIKVWDIQIKFTLVEDFIGHEDGVICLEFADNMLYSGSFDHSIRSWNLKEMENRIRERAQMFKEDIWSRKYDAWYKVLYKKKKKGKKPSKK